MRRDFNNLCELMSYVETRVIINVDKYARPLLAMGDVFTPDRDGIYDLTTGDILLDFTDGPGSCNNKSISSLEDFDRARGVIYNSRGRKVLDARSYRSMRVDRTRPLVFRAQEAAAAFAFDLMKSYHDNITMGANIPLIKDLVYMDMIEDEPAKRKLLVTLENMIHRDFADTLDEYRWHDIWISKSASTYMLDIKADTRIRDWYQNEFTRRIEEENRDDTDEDGRIIINS